MTQWWKKLTPSQKLTAVKGGISITVMAGWVLFSLGKDEPVGETGLFDDGTVRVNVDDLTDIFDTGKPKILNVENVGSFLVAPHNG